MTTRRPFGHRQIFKYHPRWGYAFRENLSTRLISADAEHESYLIETNKDGFRSSVCIEDLCSTKQTRAVLIGCSFTAGDGVPNRARFSDIVAAKLPSLAVYNAALPGSGNDQHLLIARDVTSFVTPDVLIICPYSGCASRNFVAMRPTNDQLYGTVLGRPKPYFLMQGDGLALANDPVPKRSIRRIAPLPDTAGSDAIPSKPVTKDVFGAKLKRCVDRDKGVDFPIYDGVDTEAQALLTRILKETTQVSRAEKVAFMPLPSNSDLLGVGEPSFSRFFREIARSEGADFIDVLPAFRRLKLDSLRQCFMRSDGHYSTIGHKLVADVLSTSLRSYA